MKTNKTIKTEKSGIIENNGEDDTFLTCEDDEFTTPMNKFDQDNHELTCEHSNSSKNSNSSTKQGIKKIDYPLVEPFKDKNNLNNIETTNIVIVNPTIESAINTLSIDKFTSNQKNNLINISKEDYIQIKKDMKRSMRNLDFFNQLNEEAATETEQQLEGMITDVLSMHKLHYYQGYNELCGVILLVLGKRQGTKAMEVISKILIKDFLMESFEKGVRPMLTMLSELLQKIDPELYKNFTELGVS